MSPQKQITQAQLDHRLKSLQLITFLELDLSGYHTETTEHRLCIEVLAKILDLEQFE